MLQNFNDRFHIVYIILFLHGIGALIAWNMFINADSYFVDYKLNVSDSSPTLQNYRKNFLSYLGIASKGPNILFQFINLFFSSNYRSLSTRIWISFLFQTLVFLVTIVLAIVDSTQWPEIFFWVTMLSAVAINTANGVFQGCIYGIAAKLPVQYTNIVTIGFNVSGVIAAIFMIISIAIAPTPKSVAIYFFSFAVFYLLLCFANELLLQKNNFYLHYMKANENNSNSIDLKSIQTNGYKFETKDNNNGELKSGSDNPLLGYKQYLYVFKKIWLQLLNIIIIYFITFSIFPALQANIKPLDNLISERYFVPVFCFLFFPLFKTFGNYIAEQLPKPSTKSLITYSLLRFAFIPFFIYCNFSPNDRQLPVFIKSDLIYIFGAILMALTSGYLSSISLMYCPISVEPRYASIAGMMASFTVLFGIFLGLNFSLVYPLVIK